MYVLFLSIKIPILAFTQNCLIPKAIIKFLLIPITLKTRSFHVCAIFNFHCSLYKGYPIHYNLRGQMIGGRGTVLLERVRCNPMVFQSGQMIHRVIYSGDIS